MKEYFLFLLLSQYNVIILCYIIYYYLYLRQLLYRDYELRRVILLISNAIQLLIIIVGTFYNNYLTIFL